jgi:putative redox protein
MKKHFILIMILFMQKSRWLVNALVSKRRSSVVALFSSSSDKMMDEKKYTKSYTLQGEGIGTKVNDEKKYTKSYTLQGEGIGTKVNIKTDTGHCLSTDIPLKMGGKDSAPQPVETLLAAWMGCTQATAIFVGRQLPERLAIDRIEFDNIQAFRDERGALELPIDTTPPVPSRIQKVTGTIRVYARKGKPISPDQLKILEQQTELRCPVANMMIASGCKMDVQWMDGLNQQEY